MTDLLFVVPTSFIPCSLTTSKIDIIDDDDGSEIDSTFATKQEESSEKSETLENVSEKTNSDSEDNDTINEDKDSDNNSDNEDNDSDNEDNHSTNEDKDIVQKNIDTKEDTQQSNEENTESKEDIDVEISIKNDNIGADRIQALIDSHTIKDLREMCRSKNLSARGSKKELATRYSECAEDIGDEVVICS